MTANYTGGGLSSRRYTKRRHRQDVTGTPAYIAAASQAYRARPGPVLATSAQHFAGRRKGESLANPTFDFAYLHGRRMNASKPATLLEGSTASRRRGGEPFWTADPAILPTPNEGMRQKLLAQPNWTGLHPVSRFQPSFLPSQPHGPTRLERRYRHSPDPLEVKQPLFTPEHDAPVLRGSSALPDPNQAFLSMAPGSLGLPRSTPPPLYSSHLGSNEPQDGASREAYASTETSAGAVFRSYHGGLTRLDKLALTPSSRMAGSRSSRARAISAALSDEQVTDDQERFHYRSPARMPVSQTATDQSFVDIFDEPLPSCEAGDRVGAAPAAGSVDDDTHEILSFATPPSGQTSPARLSSDGARLSSTNMLNSLMGLDALHLPVESNLTESIDSSPLSPSSPVSPAPPNGALAACTVEPHHPGLTPYYSALASSLSIDLSTFSRTPSPAPQRVYSHLGHIRQSHSQQLRDSLTLPPRRVGALFAHERMGLGCERLSDAQVGQLFEREDAVRQAGVSAVPEWAWGADGEEEEEVGKGGTGGTEEDQVQPGRTSTALGGASLPDEDDGGGDEPDDCRLSNQTGADKLDPDPPRSASPTPSPPGAWSSVRDEQVDGQLFAPEDMSGVLEP
ncbi:hypothetical protein JCM3770_001479 [Rhodotorula araucariae]